MKQCPVRYVWSVVAKLTAMRGRLGVAALVILVAAGAYGILQAQRDRDALEAALLEVLTSFDDQQRRIEALERRLAGTRSTAAPMGTVAALDGNARAMIQPSTLPPSAVAPHDSQQLEEAIAGKVETRLRDRIDALASRQKARNHRGEWEPPMNELAEELSLDPVQTEAAAAIFDRSHDDMLKLFSTPHPDGSSLLDDLAADIKSGTSPAQARETFVGRMMVEKVPGTDQAFITELFAMRQGVLEGLEEELDESQMQELKSLRVDLLNVKTEHDPVREYVIAKVRQ